LKNIKKILIPFGVMLFSLGLNADNSSDSLATITGNDILKENAHPYIACNGGAYKMYESEVVEADSLFRYSFNSYLNTWDEEKPSVYKIAKYPGVGTVKLLLFPDSNSFSMPCDNSYVTSHYGWRRGRMHRGTDIDLETGDDVRAVMDGVVRFAGWYSGYGYCVLIRHMNGLETLYAHLSKLETTSGEVVDHGTKIGLGGTTGHSTGSHLHFEVHFMGRAINPELIFDFGDKMVKTHYLIISTEGKAKAYNPDSQSEEEENTQELSEDHDAETEAERIVEDAIKANIAAKKYHYVKKGETLYGLSKTYDISIADMCDLNNMKTTATLKIGRRLRVK
jgi:hypothetical protein